MRTVHQASESQIGTRCLATVTREGWRWGIVASPARRTPASQYCSKSVFRRLGGRQPTRHTSPIHACQYYIYSGVPIIRHSHTQYSQLCAAPASANRIRTYWRDKNKTRGFKTPAPTAQPASYKNQKKVERTQNFRRPFF